LVATLRSEAPSSSAILARWPLTELVRHVAVAGLPAADATELAARLAGEHARAIDAAAIARAASGHPLFIDELVRHAIGEAPLRSELGLHDALRARIAQLPCPQRRVLDALASAQAPLETGVLAAVIGCPDLALLQRDLASLRTSSLIRVAGARTTDAVELYH